MTTVGFVGAGVMGAPMIANLVGAGHRVRAFGRSDRSRERIISAGGQSVPTLAEVADDAGVVITMVADSPDVHDVVLSEDGVAGRLEPGQILVEMSTVSPETAREVSTVLARRGVAALDAPVSGGEQAAIDGTLSIMVGGDADTLTMVRPLLAVIGTSITHVGPAGSGQLTKAANQLVVAANIQAVAEALVFLTSADVNLGAALTAIGGGLAGSAVLERKRHSFLTGDFTPGFRVALHDKDLRIVAETARAQGNALPLTALVSQFMSAVKARGDGHLDHSALLKLVQHLNEPLGTR